MSVRYTIIRTSAGWMVVGGTERGLRFLTLPRSYRESVLDGNEGLFRDAVEDSSVFGDLPLRLQRYFDGEKVTFPDTLDFSEATAFQETVWGETRSISYGEVKSYSWLARQIGKPQACRAVGRALARNRLPIIVPCHRVVASDGGLGGFSGGLWLKRRLLELEAGRL